VKASPSTVSQTSSHFQWAEPMSGGTAEDLYLRLSQVTGRHLCFGAVGNPFHPSIWIPSPCHTSRKRRDIDIDVAASHRGSLDPHVYIDAIGVPRGCHTNLKTEIKLNQDLNQYFFGGPP
jgi:hypothetical protein